MATQVPAVASSVRIMERLALEWPDAVSPRELVDELGLNRSTCYNILATLHQAGWVRPHGDRGGWTLGPKLLTLTGVTEDLANSIVQEEIEALTRRLGFVVFVVEPNGLDSYVAVAKAEQRLGVRVTVGVGQSFEFSAPALMNAFYAWRPRHEFNLLFSRIGVKAFTSNTLTDLKSLHAELDRTQERGFSISLQQFDLAQSGVAAPIFDRHGQVSSVVCSLAFSSELHKDNIERVGTLLADCAARITERRGGQVPSRPPRHSVA